jgi:hypothetical protein
MTEELWSIRGYDPVQWSIPFYVTPQGPSEESSAFPAIPLLRIQQSAVNARLKPRARLVNGIWMITRLNLHQIGTMATAGVDPETLLAWDRKPLKQALKRPEKNVEREEFLDALYQVGIGKSREEIAHWWYVFCNHALDWIINKERPVDMFFTRIHPMPYRANWIERTEARRMKLYSKRQSLMQPDWLKKWFENSTLLGLNRDGTINRHMTLEFMPLWWQTIKLVEQTRLQRLKRFRYAACVIESIRQASPAAARIYRTWLAQKKALPALFNPGRAAGDVWIGPCPIVVEKWGPTADWGTSPKYRIAVRNSHPEMAAKLDRRSKALLRKNGKLPALPDFQSEVQDVRNGGDAG